MTVGPGTKITWPLLLVIIGFAVFATVLKRYLEIQNDMLWYAGVSIVAVVIVLVVNKLKK